MGVLGWGVHVLQLIYFFLPAGLANMAPVIVGRHFAFLNIPVDGGKTFRGERLFGAHKTWRGILAAVVFGQALFCVQQWAALNVHGAAEWSAYDIRTLPWWFGALLGATAIGGDLVKSFCKRRVNIAPGKSWFPFDQLDAFILTLLAAQFFVPVGWYVWVLTLVIGPLLHIFANHLGYWLGMKESKW